MTPDQLRELIEKAKTFDSLEAVEELFTLSPLLAELWEAAIQLKASEDFEDIGPTTITVYGPDERIAFTKALTALEQA